MPGRGLMRTERWPCSFHRFQRRKQPIQVRPQSECLPSARARARAPTMSMWLEPAEAGPRAAGAAATWRGGTPASPTGETPAPPGLGHPVSFQREVPLAVGGPVLGEQTYRLLAGQSYSPFAGVGCGDASFSRIAAAAHFISQALVTTASALRQCLAVQRAVICSSQRPDATAPRNDATYHCGRLWRRPVRCVRRRPVPLFQWAASLQHVRRWAPAGVQRRWLRAARPSHLSAADAAGQEQPPDQR